MSYPRFSSRAKLCACFIPNFICDFLHFLVHLSHLTSMLFFNFMYTTLHFFLVGFHSYSPTRGKITMLVFELRRQHCHEFSAEVVFSCCPILLDFRACSCEYLVFSLPKLIVHFQFCTLNAGGSITFSLLNRGFDNTLAFLSCAFHLHLHGFQHLQHVSSDLLLFLASGIGCRLPESSQLGLLFRYYLR